MNVYNPSVPLARLYEKNSKKGVQYFVGRMGLCKVVLLRSQELSESGEPIWLLSVQEPAAKPPMMKEALATRASSLFLAPQKRAAASGTLPNDSVADLWPDHRGGDR
jgi:hypothetical protein